VVLGTAVDEGVEDDGDDAPGDDGTGLAVDGLVFGSDLASSVFALPAHADTAKTAVSASALAPRRTAWFLTTVLGVRYSGALKISGLHARHVASLDIPVISHRNIDPPLRHPVRAGDLRLGTARNDHRCGHESGARRSRIFVR
jgi:hypothetical protein